MTSRRKLSITRESRGNGFEYRLDGRRITKRSELERIESLAIPPAWVEVEISRSPTAKVQARGVDAARRAQVLYHSAFRKRQDRRKFARMTRFARSLPKLRARVDRDLRRRTLGRERIAACVIHLIDEQLFRVGNPEYAATYGSFGITTLRKEHLDVTPTMVDFNFVGKSGKEHHQRVRDARTARLLAQLIELPGPEVFSFIDDYDTVRSIQSRHINAYVHRYLGREFSAKDFRTWGGTVTVSASLLAADPEDMTTETGRATAVRAAVKEAAARLGNTPEVTRSSYVDPRVLKAADHPRVLERIRRMRFRSREYLSTDEQRTLALLSVRTR